MKFKIFLWLIFLFCKIEVSHSQEWFDPSFSLSAEATESGVGLELVTGTITIRVPETFEANVALGGFNFNGTQVTSDCYGVGIDGSKVDDVKPFFPDVVLQGEAVVFEDTVDYEIDFAGLNLDRFKCELKIDDLQCTTSLCRDLIVIILNANDNSPSFDENYPSRIDFPENTVNETVILFKASDKDSLGQMTFKVESEDGFDFGDKFRMVKNDDFSSWLSITNLDYEEQISHLLAIIVEDSPDAFGEVKTSRRNLEVRVNDLGDNPPRWSKTPPTLFDLQEHTEVGTVLFTIAAIDGDRGVRNNISYEIPRIVYNDDESFTFLTVNDDGEVILKEAIDREKFGSNNLFTVTFSATEENCSENCSTEIDSLGQFADINDNPPMLHLSIREVNLTENFVGQIQNLFGDPFATDADVDIRFSSFDIKIDGHEDHDELIQYLRVEPSYGVGNTSFQFIVEKKGEETYFDFEKRQEITFDIVVSSRELPFEEDRITLVINLLDVNDFQPNFDEAEYTRDAIKEDLSNLGEPGDGLYKLAAVSAHDGDKSEAFGNSSLRYTIFPQSNVPLVIDEITGDIYLNVSEGKDIFDYEAIKKYQFTIEVRDCGDCDPSSTVQRSNSKFSFEISDSNDVQPKVTIPTSDACIFEGEAAYWPDTHPDECRELYSIPISAADQDTDARLVLDIDWTRSEARKDYRTVNVKDYNYTNCFEVNMTSGADTGEVQGFIKQGSVAIDREQVDELFLQVRVRDLETVSGSEEHSVLLYVEIFDLDDTAPRFLNDPTTWQFSIEEFDAVIGDDSQYNGTKLSQRVLVADDDVEQQFFFELKGDQVSDGLIGFAENPTNGSEGVLVIKNVIDREASEIIAVNGVLSYLLTVTDAAGNANYQNISVTIIDVNDCIPKFTESIYNVSVSEGLKVGELIDLKINATDDDVSESLSTVYFEIQETNLPFNIDKNSGQMSIASELDYEKTNFYSFNVKARDTEGGRGNQELHTVTIYVCDENDNAPILDNTLQQREFFNDININVPLITYKATDADSGLNRQLTFRAEGLDSKFMLSSNGELNAKESLMSVHSEFTFNLIVEDSGTPKLNDTLMCTVVINDKNDQIPIYELPKDGKETVTVSLNSSVEEVLRDVDGREIIFKAVDLDVYGPFKTVNYVLNAAKNDPAIPDFFRVESTTGKLILKQELSKYSTNLFSIFVDAFDNPPQADDPQLSNRVFGELIVRTTLNIAPAFSMNSTVLEFKEGPVDDVAPFRIPEATDDEDFLNDTICYYIFENPEEFFLDKDQKPPMMSVVKPLDRESVDVYNFHVVASNDCQNPPESLDDTPLKSVLSVKIQVLDINDEVPTFDVDSEGYIWSMSVENPAQWSKDIKGFDSDLNEVLAFDFDGHVNVSEGSQGISQLKDPFLLSKIDSMSAKITSQFTPTSDMSGYFTFDVKAVDQASHSRSVHVKIVIIAKDNQVIVTFNNAPQEIDEKRSQIVDAFESAFEGWRFTMDIVLQKSSTFFDSVRDFFDDRAVSTDQTRIQCYFVDRETYDPISRQEVQAKYDIIYTNLTLELFELGLTLDRENGFDTGDGGILEETVLEIPNAVALSAIVIGCILIIIVVFLAIAYKMRVSGLERRIKAAEAMEDSAGRDTKDGFDPNILPGTNANSGFNSNPVWDPDTEEVDPAEAKSYLTALDLKHGNTYMLYRRDGEDSTSLNSGDSVLIGVEDQPEFRGFQEQDEEFDNLSVGSDASNNFKKLRSAGDQSKISIFLRPAFETSNNFRQNPLYNEHEESAL